MALREAETAYDQLRAYAYRFRTTRRAFSRELQELLTKKEKPVSGSVCGNLREETNSAFQETAARRTDPLSGVA